MRRTRKSVGPVRCYHDHDGGAVDTARGMDYAKHWMVR